MSEIAPEDDVADAAFRWLVENEGDLGIDTGSWLVLSPQGVVARSRDLEALISEYQPEGLLFHFVDFTVDSETGEAIVEGPPLENN